MVFNCFLFIALVPSTLVLVLSLPPPPNNDTSALLDFKTSISHDPSNRLGAWNPNSDYCNWFGVTCDAHSPRVISLDFASQSLAGFLPLSIGQLTHLRILVISHNAFSGQIPLTIGALHFLQILELQGNNFSGNIPHQISILPSLSLLNLSFNSFTGQIPDTLIGYGNLQTMDLSNNHLTGEIKIDASSECSVLRHLKLSNNLLNKTIPKEIGKCNNLTTLLLDGNLLEGPIPAEIGLISELSVLDVSTNCLTDKIPKELANCQKLSIFVLTNSSNFVGNGSPDSDDHSSLDFNAFDGSIPYEVWMIPSLQILWAPRANLGGWLPANWSDSCSLRVVHLGLNSFKGVVPKGLSMCKNLTFLDLSSNYMVGHLPLQLQVPCMVYFNVSRNNMSGAVPSFGKGSCDVRMISFSQDHYHLHKEDVQIAYSNIPVWGPQVTDDFVIVQDFSWNQFDGLLPSFSVGDAYLSATKKPSYRLLLNNNMFNGALPNELVLNCSDLLSFSVSLSANNISGEIHESLFRSCHRITQFEAAHNQIGGSLPASIGNLGMLQDLDIRGNRLSGSVPNQLGDLRLLESILLGRNNVSGNIPSQLGQLTSLTVLDLSHNALTGSIPDNLTNATSLQIVLLNNNGLSGRISSSFSNLHNLTVFDVSFNNLSGPIPDFLVHINCDWFIGNPLLDPCLDSSTDSPFDSNEDGKWLRHRSKKFLIAVVTSASVVLCFLLMVIVVSIYRKQKFSRRLSSLSGKVVVTFGDAPAELSYDGVVRATGNFSIRNLIGSGGFGSTYKAELVPGYFIAVKRLSLGRFQGIQQFDAEIRTLGRIRHRNLVTLIGYYVGEAEMFLVYNYLSGGNLETFIHETSSKRVQWSMIYKIALDIAQALAYLHYSCVPRVLHRDIKPSNILLDEELNAYLSDFGLARLLEVSQTHATTDVAGTFGYVAPEYATTCRVSDKSDVYSFGVVLLELMSGKKSLDPSFSEYGNGFNIVAWAKMLIKEGRSPEFFSKELLESGPKENLIGMLKLASACTVESLSVRLSMKQVLEKLKQLKS
ncbi:LRR receptor-like serine/threonine-protein kinase RPK2 [Euphorbia lathyris]|uniref:LRR receptor-like serine/threonine-protein kinase RPK2 n=1 Tax=Euphorbia lathyris TaxID=212925 RepID=UPI00331353FD